MLAVIVRVILVLMDDAAIEDLKQFIATTIRQEISSAFDNPEGKVAKIEDKLNKLDQKVDEGFAGVGEAMSDMAESVDKTLDDHEQRIRALESKTI